MLINSTNGSFFFTLFYTLAFLATFIILITEGYKRKIPIVSWVLLLIFSKIAFIVGTKIFTFNYDEWRMMITQTTLIPTSEKILLGGLLLGLFALISGKYILRIKQNIFNAFALALPLGIGIQKIGCFLNGCCFGNPTSSGWGVHYGVNTLPHYHQFKAGLIGSTDFISLPIHPVQLYEMAGAFIAAFLVYKTRKSWKANGSLVVFSIFCYSAVRFIAEFFRAVPAHTIGGEMAGPLNQIQWFMLLMMAVLSFILLQRERQLKPHTQLVSIPLGIHTYFGVFILEAILITTLHKWFSTSELISILLTFLISSLILFIYLLREIASSKKRIIYAGLLLLPLLITSQTIQPTKRDSTLVNRTRKISLGMSSGSFKNSLSRISGTDSEGCNTYETEYFKQKYSLGGAGYSIKDEYPNKKFSITYGANLYFGQNKQLIESSGLETKTMLYGINPYFKLDAKWYGLGGGIHTGNILTYKDQIVDYGSLSTGVEKNVIFPQLYVRLGNWKSIFIDYHLGDQFPSPFPASVQQIAIGTGFGSNDVSFRIGGNISPLSGTFVSAYFPLSESLLIEPFFVFQDSKVTHFALSLHYKLSSTSFYKNRR